MALPFILSNADWQNLKPRITEGLADPDVGVDPKQAKVLNVFRTLDLRVEWDCRQTVINRNLLLLVAVLTFALTLLHLAQMVPLFRIIAGSL
jgi:hypothetical protein